MGRICMGLHTIQYIHQYTELDTNISPTWVDLKTHSNATLLQQNYVNAYRRLTCRVAHQFCMCLCVCNLSSQKRPKATGLYPRWTYGRESVLVPYGSLELFKQDRLLHAQHALCHSPVHSTHRIHPGPTELAAGPARLLTSEPTSRGMQPAGRGEWRRVIVSHFGNVFCMSAAERSSLFLSLRLAADG